MWEGGRRNEDVFRPTSIYPSAPARSIFDYSFLSLISLSLSFSRCLTLSLAARSLFYGLGLSPLYLSLSPPLFLGLDDDAAADEGDDDDYQADHVVDLHDRCYHDSCSYALVLIIFFAIVAMLF